MPREDAPAGPAAAPRASRPKGRGRCAARADGAATRSMPAAMRSARVSRQYRRASRRRRRLRACPLRGLPRGHRAPRAAPRPTCCVCGGDPPIPVRGRPPALLAACPDAKRPSPEIRSATRPVPALQSATLSRSATLPRNGTTLLPHLAPRARAPPGPRRPARPDGGRPAWREARARTASASSRPARRAL